MSAYRIQDHLYLVSVDLPKSSKAVAKERNVNHILVIDCSGSMSYDLPRIREQLKRKVPKMLRKGDTLSIVWFSGRTQFGTLLEAEPVSDLVDLQGVNQAIDRWLRPICLTGFKEPLQEARALIERISQKNGNLFALFFMSDGCDNQWGRVEILQAIQNLDGKLASATFVEYGYYADRPLLTSMAEKAGGNLIFSEDFDRYAPTFEATLAKSISGAPRKEVPLRGDPIEGFAFALSDEDIIAYGIEGGSVSVPTDLDSVWYLSLSPVGKRDAELAELAKEASKGIHRNEQAMAAAYAAVGLYAQRMKPDVVYPVLKALGDAAFITAFSSCFGKQKYSEFVEQAKNAAFSTKDRFTDGWDPTKVPQDDAFTILDLLRILNDDDENRLLLDSDDFEYSRIGRGQVDASVKEIELLQEQIAVEQNASRLQELRDQLAALEKIPPLKFEADPEPNGYPVSALTFNETRPNVSVLVRKEGAVDLSARLGKKEYPKLPRKFPTYIHRNYAILKDGVVNVKRLPVRMTKGTIVALRKAGFPLSAILNPKGETLAETLTRVKKAAAGRSVSIVIDLRALPVINRQMVKDTSAKLVIEKAYAMTKAKAAQKVFNSVKKAEFLRTSEGFKIVYGEDAAAWLKDQGITDYNGFNPRTVQVAASDFYMGKELDVKLKGLSTLPTYTDVQKRMASGKHTASSALMSPYAQEVLDFLASDTYLKAKNQPQIFEAWLDGQLKASRNEARKLMFELAQIKFAVVVGQIWFTEFQSLDENTLVVDGVEGTIEMREVEVKV